MFVKAIETATKFTRPIHTIIRNYNTTEIQTSAASLFFINSSGWALTCAHVIDLIIGAEKLREKKEAFKRELLQQKGKLKESRLRNELEKKYQYKKNTPYEIHNRMMNCIKGNLDVRFFKHPKLDVALIKFEGYDELLCNTFPIFPSDTSILKQGKYLCRLGFPFPEFTNYTFDTQNDQISWTNTGQENTPIFPIEGMLTRHLVDENGTIVGFELSTPGLMGQSGGPAFDFDGKIWGMQSRTRHLDLNFDINQEVMRQGKKKFVSDHAFLHVGMCIHVDILKSFMRDKGVQFQVE